VPVYIGLFKFSGQGITNIKGSPSRIQDTHKLIETMGGKSIAQYSVLGEYDFVYIYEFPNDETAASFALALSSKGNIRTTTMRAFSLDEFSNIVSKVP